MTLTSGGTSLPWGNEVGRNITTHFVAGEPMIKAALILRVSSDEQFTANQLPDLEALAHLPR